MHDLGSQSLKKEHHSKISARRFTLAQDKAHKEFRQQAQQHLSTGPNTLNMSLFQSSAQIKVNNSTDHFQSGVEVTTRTLKLGSTRKSRTQSQQVLPQIKSQKHVTPMRLAPRKFDSVLTNLNEHIEKGQKLAAQDSAKLDEKVFHSRFNSYERQEGSANVRFRTEAKNNFLQRNNCEINLITPLPEQKKTQKRYKSHLDQESIFSSAPNSTIPMKKRSKGNEMRFFTTGMEEPATTVIEAEISQPPSELRKTIDYFPQVKIHMNINKQPVNNRVGNFDDSRPEVGDWKKIKEFIPQTMTKAQKQENALKVECEQGLREENGRIKTKYRVKQRKDGFTCKNLACKTIPTVPQREVQPTSTLAWFNKKTIEREQKRKALDKKKRLRVIKKVMKLKKHKDINKMMDDLIFPTGKPQNKHQTRKEVSIEEQMKAISEESEEDRLNFYQDIDQQIDEMNGAIKRKELNVADEAEMREYATKQAKLMMEVVFTEKLVQLKAQSEATQGDQEAYIEYEHEIKSQIGLQIFAIMAANQTMLQQKMKRTKAYDEFLQWLVNGLVDEHTLKNMNFSTWKDFRRKRNEREDESSEDSFYSGVDSDYECRDNVEERAMALVRNHKYKTVSKQAHRKGADYKQDIDFVYQNEVKLDKKMPLSAKVMNRYLVLQDYTLTIGQCMAFATVLQRAKSTYLEGLILENCGIDDNELARLFEGLQKQDNFRSFHYKQNQFLKNSLEALKPILAKSPPACLYELVMVSVRSQPSVITEMCSHIYTEAHNLRSLRLVSMNLSGNCVRIIADAVKNSSWLTQLDLTKNERVMPSGWIYLLEVLDKNRTLSWVNLSHNMLINPMDQSEQGNISHLLFGKYSKFAPIREFVLAKHAKEKANRKNSYKTHSETHSEIVARCLSNLCKHSPCIQYMDFEMCGLSHMILGRMLEAIRRCKSLQSLHVGYNPGIGAQINRVAKLRLHMKTRKPSLDLVIEKSKILNQTNLYEIEGVKVGGLMKKKIQFKQLEHMTEINEFFPLNITRIIGHREEMPESGRWHVAKNCWMRDLHQYSLLMWGKKIDEHFKANKIQLDSEQMEQYSGQIIDYNAEVKREMQYDVPVVCSEQTNWKARKMYSLLSYLQMRKPIQPDFQRQVKYELENDYEFKDHLDAKVQDRMGHWVEKKDSDKEELIKEYKANKMIEMVQKYEDNLINSWAAIIRGNGVFNPVIVNQDLVDLDPRNVYVLPIVLKPGKHNFFIYTNENGSLKPHYMRHIAGCRQEQVHQYTKTLRKNEHVREFDITTSVFKDWRQDNKRTMEKCIEHDTLYWKVDKLKTPDGRNINGIIEVLKEYWPNLNENFLMNVSRTSYPTLNMTSLRRLCQQSKMIDTVYTQVMFEQDFILTNEEICDQEHNPDHEIMRFEFWEILIRIAKRKYIDTKREISIAVAFEKLVKELILHDTFQTKLHEQRSAMREIFYTLPVHDLLHHNIETLKLFYKSVCKNSNSHILSRKVAIDMFLVKYENIGVDYRHIQQAYGLSKMTVVNENEAEGQKEYGQIQFVEFLDMICRLAYKKFEGMQATFQKKLCIMLENLLKQEGLTVEMPPEDSDSESETDDDY